MDTTTQKLALQGSLNHSCFSIVLPSSLFFAPPARPSLKKNRRTSSSGEEISTASRWRMLWLIKSVPPWMDNLPSKYTDQVIQAVTFVSPIWRSSTTFQRITFSLTIPKRGTRIARYGVFMCMYTYILNTYK